MDRNPEADLVPEASNRIPWLLLVIVHVIVFGLLCLRGGNPLHVDTIRLLSFGAAYGPRVSHGEWWRLLTTIFVHGSIFQLAATSIALAQAGPLADRVLGRNAALATFLLSGAAGAVWGVQSHPYSTSVGAAGAAFGLIGALLGYSMQGTDKSSPLRRLVPSLGALIAAGVFPAAAGGPPLDFSCQLGGMIAGFALGFAAARDTRAFRTAALVATVVCVLGTASLPKRPDIIREIAQARDALKHVQAAIEKYKTAGETTNQSHQQLVLRSQFVQREILAPLTRSRDQIARLGRLEDGTVASSLAHIKDQEEVGIASFRAELLHLAQADTVNQLIPALKAGKIPAARFVEEIVTRYLPALERAVTPEGSAPNPAQARAVVQRLSRWHSILIRLAIVVESSEITAYLRQDVTRFLKEAHSAAPTERTLQSALAFVDRDFTNHITALGASAEAVVHRLPADPEHAIERRMQELRRAKLLVTAYGLDSLARLRFDTIAYGMHGRKLQALEVSGRMDRTVLPLLASYPKPPEPNGRAPSSTQPDPLYNEIKQLQDGRRAVIQNLEQGLRARDRMAADRAIAGWKAVNNGPVGRGLAAAVFKLLEVPKAPAAKAAAPAQAPAAVRPAVSAPARR